MTAFIPVLLVNLRQIAVVQPATHRLLGNGLNRVYLHSTFTTSSSLNGLEEFFPPLTGNPTDLVEELEKAGQLNDVIN